MQKQRIPSPYFEKIVSAFKMGNTQLLRSLVKEGGDLNELDEYGVQSAFFTAVEDLSGAELGGSHSLPVLTTIREAFNLGCNPYPIHFILKHFDEEGRLGIFSGPVLEHDLELMALLLSCGVDPNWSVFRLRELQEPKIYSLSSEAETRYTDFEYGLNEPLPDPWTESDKASRLSWLDYLDRMAIRHGVRRPDILYLLNDFGARSLEGIQQAETSYDGYKPLRTDYGMFIAVASCIGRNDIDALKKLIRVGGDLNAVGNYDPAGFTLYECTPVSVAIHWLCQPLNRYFCNRLEIVSKVFSLGVDPNLPELMDNNLGLIWPITWHQDAEMMALLLSLGADPNLPIGFEGESIFDAAVGNYFVKKCPNIQSQSLLNGITSAREIYAHCERVAIECEAEPPRILKVLLDHGAMTGEEIDQKRASGCKA